MAKGKRYCKCEGLISDDFKSNQKGPPWWAWPGQVRLKHWTFPEGKRSGTAEHASGSYTRGHVARSWWWLFTVGSYSWSSLARRTGTRKSSSLKGIKCFKEISMSLEGDSWDPGVRTQSWQTSLMSTKFGRKIQLYHMNFYPKENCEIVIDVLNHKVSDNLSLLNIRLIHQYNFQK